MTCCGWLGVKHQLTPTKTQHDLLWVTGGKTPTYSHQDPAWLTVGDSTTWPVLGHEDWSVKVWHVHGNECALWVWWCVHLDTPAIFRRTACSSQCQTPEDASFAAFSLRPVLAFFSSFFSSSFKKIIDVTLGEKRRRKKRVCSDSAFTHSGGGQAANATTSFM